MNNKKHYSFRLEISTAEKLKKSAEISRRTLSAELGLLIEQGIKWREEHENKQA